MGIISPDPSFMHYLKGLSTDLGCHFDNIEKRFVVTCKRASGGSVAIHQIRNEDGSFRQPRMSDIDFIAEGDTHKSTPKERAQKIAKYCEDYNRNMDRKAEVGFRDRSKDDKLQLMRAIGNLRGGKSIQPFRKIERKPTGKVF